MWSSVASETAASPSRSRPRPIGVQSTSACAPAARSDVASSIALSIFEYSSPGWAGVMRKRCSCASHGPSSAGAISPLTVRISRPSRIGAMVLIHTCYRITEPERSVAFYEALGFEKRRELPIRDEAINIFMGLPGDADRLELTYNFGVDSYELGTGYGHIAVTVDDLDATLERLAGQGIEPERAPYRVREGGSRLCFVRDPDSYRIELIERA